MDVFGLPLQTLYLYILMISGILTLVFVFFGDVFDGMFEAIPVPFLQPTLILAFLTFFSAGGFISEKTAIVGSGLGAVLSAILAVILVTCLNVFVLVPLSSAEESLLYGGRFKRKNWGDHCICSKRRVWRSAVNQ